MFYKLKLEKAIVKWRQMRINLIVFAEKKPTLEPKVLEEQNTMLKVPQKLFEEGCLILIHSMHLRVLSKELNSYMNTLA